MTDVKKVADEADMIVNGYAYTQNEEGCRVLNLNRPDKATVLSKTGEVLETSMDDIEIQIVKSYLEKNKNLWRDGMPKYYEFKIAGYYLYFTSHCIIECMHVHASDRKLTESGSAKFFVRENGDTVLQNRGILNDREIRIIQGFIKQNYQEMYLKWAEYSSEGFYNNQV